MRSRYLILLILGICFARPLQGQNVRRPSLTVLLESLSAEHDTPISFSPSLTDRVFPKQTDTSGTPDEALQRILSGTDFSFRFIGGKYYYVYKKAVRPSTKPAERTAPPASIVADTQHMHTVVLDMQELVRVSHPVSWPGRGVPQPDARIVARVARTSATQTPEDPLFAVKTNMLYDATSTLNLGVEIALGGRTTLDLSGNYNPWTFSDNRKMKHWLVQPEFRYWTCKRFSGGFWGVHVHYGQYNWGGMMPWGFHSGKMFGRVGGSGMLDNRYEGWLVGAGVGYGYHWILGNRWGLEAQIGLGYAYLDYGRYPSVKCGRKIANQTKHYFGPTKAAVNIVFLIK